MRRPAAGRARAALLAGLAAFVGLQLGLGLLIALRSPDLRDPPYFDRAERLRARAGAPGRRPFLVVALGTSRTAEGFRGRVVEEELSRSLGGPVAAFNFGVPGAGPVSGLVYLRRLLAAGVRPDLLLVEVLPLSLPPAGLDSDLGRLTGGRLAWDELGLVARYGGSAEDLAAAWARSWLLPWHEQRFVLLGRLGRSGGCLARSVDGWGQVGRPRGPMTPEQRRQMRQRVARQFRPVLARFEIAEGARRAYREVLEVCRRERVPAALVWMPEGPAFRGLYSAEGVGRVEAFLDELGREFGVPVINARVWMAEDDFSDSHHLQPAAAERFSARLAREVLPAGGAF